MEEQIVKLAKEKGFKSSIVSNEEWKYSNKEDLRWLFWLTNLQKWLRERHQLMVMIEILKVSAADKDGYRFTWFIIDGNNLGEIMEEDISALGFLTYEEALEDGLLQALRLIS